MNTVLDTNAGAINQRNYDLNVVEELKKSTALEELLSTISMLVQDELKSQQQKSDNTEEKFIGYLNDFASQEYIDKNIRVIPQEKGKDENKIGGLGMAPFNSEQDDDNSNRMLSLELEESRVKAKKEKEERLKKQKLEEERKRKR